ncbi:MAG: hypothetical protein HC888_17950, partial [Candidatus Competibacteraceae bacterium]|nr:hypothetical protein [Candidatus Competibacteraceae bacterium]
KRFLLAGLALAALSLVSASRIVVKTQMKDMMKAGNPRVESFDEISRIFGGTSVLITIEGRDKARMAVAAEALASAIRQSPQMRPFVRSVSAEMDRGFVTTWGLMLQEPSDLRRTGTLLKQPSLLPLVTALNNNLEDAYTGDEADKDLETGTQESDAVAAIVQLGGFAEDLASYMGSSGAKSAQAAAQSLADRLIVGDLYTYSPDGSLLIFSWPPPSI